MKKGKPSQNRTPALNLKSTYSVCLFRGSWLRLNEEQFENSRINLSEVITYEKPKSKNMLNTFYLVFHARSIKKKKQFG